MCRIPKVRENPGTPEEVKASQHGCSRVCGEVGRRLEGWAGAVLGRE